MSHFKVLNLLRFVFLVLIHVIIDSALQSIILIKCLYFIIFVVLMLLLKQCTEMNIDD